MPNRLFLGIMALVFSGAAALANYFPRTYVWLTFLVYSVGFLGFAIFTFFAFRKMNQSPNNDRLVLRVTMAATGKQLGWKRIPVRILAEATQFLMWPAQLLTPVYLGLAARKISGGVSMAVVAQPLVPAWMQPTVILALTMIPLILTGLPLNSFPMIMLVSLLIGTTFALLMLYTLAGSIKDSILSRVGNVKLSLLIVGLSSLACAAISRMWLTDLFHRESQTVAGSSYAIISLRDVTSAFARIGISPELLANNPGAARNMMQMQAHEIALILLSGLFYVSIFSFLKDIISAKREARHHLTLGNAHSAIGNLDTAISHLNEARDIPSTWPLLTGLRLRQGNFKELRANAKRACTINNLEYALEEECVLATMGNAAFIPLSGEDVANYLNSLEGQFSDPSFPGCVVSLLAAHIDTDALFETLGESSGILSDPWFMSFAATLGEDWDDALSSIEHEEPATLCARLMRLNASVHIIAQASPDQETLAELSAGVASDMDSLSLAVDAGLAHWQTMIGYQVLLRTAIVAQAFSADVDQAALDALAQTFRLVLAESSVFGEGLKTLTDLEQQEKAEALSLLRQLPSA